ncbi:ArsR family transcriptional regulator [Streptomyces sp. NPDC046866]|uniref:ArsR/SmtB family transcription factor n=1 Tax=Streptomyces sp. NPDC046866 TaxID=3154921 RepID=UPI0034555725
MRFAVSPLWQAVGAFRLLRYGAYGAGGGPVGGTGFAGHPVHRPWLEQVRPRVAAAGLDRGWLAELIPAAGYAPDFLTPAPAGPAPALEQELAEVRAAPALRVRHDLDHLAHHRGGRLGPRLRTLHAQPEERLARVAEEIEALWELAVAPYWARIRTVLDADVLHRARQAAEHGAARLLGDLHPGVSWTGDALRLARRRHTLHRATAGPGLVLLPSVFKGTGLSTRVAPPDPPQLVYPARGTGSLWAARPSGAAVGTSLAAVFGRSRTLLLTELDSPASTTELAHRTGLSPARVSQCLIALREAGLVSSHRAGRSVLYARTGAAEAVLAAASSA